MMKKQKKIRNAITGKKTSLHSSDIHAVLPGYNLARLHTMDGRQADKNVVVNLNC